jgi:hypothetical protein
MIRTTLLFTCAYLACVLLLVFSWDGLTHAWAAYTGFTDSWLQYVPAVVLGAVTILPWPIFYFLTNRTPAWHKEVLTSGREAPAVVRAVQRTGFSQNNVNYARLILDVHPKGGPPFEAKFELPELRVFLLDKGDTVYVMYDPQNTRHVVLVPHERRARTPETHAKAAPDLTSQLERLASLHQAGQLTLAEFEAAKRKLLG